MKKTTQTKKQCANCGYKHVHLHGGKCPMCKPCSKCKKKLHECICHEGE